MAVLTQTAVTGVNGPVTVTKTTLTSSDTMTYVSGSALILENTTGSIVTVTITGSGATVVSPDGYGGTVSVSSGKAIAVPANGYVYLALDKISAYLVGNVTLTGGVGVVALLIK